MLTSDRGTGFNAAEAGAPEPAAANRFVGEKTLYDYIYIVLRDKWLVAFGALLFAAAALVVCKMQTKIYESEAQFVANKDVNAMSIANILEMHIGTESYTTSQFFTNYFANLYQQILLSNEVLGSLVDTTFRPGVDPPTSSSLRLVDCSQLQEPKSVKTVFGVQAGVPAHERTEMIGMLRESAIKMSFDKFTGSVSLRFLSPDPQFCALAANLMVERLIEKLIRERNSQIDALSKTTKFNLTKAEAAMKEAEDKLKTFRQSNRSLATAQLQSMEATLTRDLKEQETLYLTLSEKIKEIALLQEQSTSPVTVIQKALPPDQKTYPQTRLAVAMWGVIGLFFMLLTVSIRNGLYEAAVETPERHRALMKQLRPLCWLCPPLFLCLPPRRWIREALAARQSRIDVAAPKDVDRDEVVKDVSAM
ncbi:MAG: Wzz/FepE/Etk N-terminal domain-containing protein [Candidatus Sumerlaeota bacterium]|nr:Wzz/FepE/Etk N-terminal domain-containing protein [Candidatus Sumerlaeota bacterium]